MGKPIYIVMGVSGTGKTTIGELLAKNLKLPFFDGDDFHPEANIKKMASGKPLTDLDRKGWLTKLNRLAIEHKPKGAVIACSALKEKYRLMLKESVNSQMEFIFLDASFEQIKNRMAKRKDHFMPIKLLQSQFDTLEPPQNAIKVEASKSPKKIIELILNQINKI